MNLHRLKEVATSQLCAAMPEGFKAKIAGLVEMFLVEVYRCKLCQFTSSSRNQMTHLARMCKTGTAHQISGCPKMDQNENESYSMGDEASQENKENEENLAFQVLQMMSPHCCDVSPSSQSNNPYASHSCEVNTLFGEAAARLQLEESCSAVPTSLSYSKSKDKEEAQSVHLGLCCVSSVRTQTLAGEIKAFKAELRCKNNKIKSE